jgi:hypothetical protein
MERFDQRLNFAITLLVSELNNDRKVLIKQRYGLRLRVCFRLETKQAKSRWACLAEEVGGEMSQFLLRPDLLRYKMNFSRERSVSIVFSAVSSCVAQGRGFNQRDEGRLSDGQVAGRDCKIRLENKPQLVKPCIVIAAEPGIYNFMLVHQLGRTIPQVSPFHHAHPLVRSLIYTCTGSSNGRPAN